MPSSLASSIPLSTSDDEVWEVMGDVLVRTGTRVPPPSTAWIPDTPYQSRNDRFSVMGYIPVSGKPGIAHKVKTTVTGPPISFYHWIYVSAAYRMLQENDNSLNKLASYSYNYARTAGKRSRSRHQDEIRWVWPDIGKALENGLTIKTTLSETPIILPSDAHPPSSVEPPSDETMPLQNLVELPVPPPTPTAPQNPIPPPPYIQGTSQPQAPPLEQPIPPPAPSTKTSRPRRRTAILSIQKVDRRVTRSSNRQHQHQRSKIKEPLTSRRPPRKKRTAPHPPRIKIEAEVEHGDTIHLAPLPRDRATNVFGHPNCNKPCPSY
ncbi:hypothetical protein TWF281_007854 [Arthrobotrys megalospora]